MKTLAILSLALAPLALGCTIRSESQPGIDTDTSGGNAPPSYSYGEHSANLETYQMAASMSAQSDGTTVTIYAALLDVSTDEGVILDQGDFFTASTGSGDPLVLVLEPSSDATVIHYSAKLPAATSAQDITIAFVRQSGRTSAPRSIVHVPAAFTLVATGPQTVKYGDSVGIRATPALTGDNVLEATGSCLVASDYDQNPYTYTNVLSFDANGETTIDTSLLQFGNYENSGQTCNISFYVSAVQEGSLDPEFAGGVTGGVDAEGQQRRSIPATITF